MSHDLYASWASSEIANICYSTSSLFFKNTTSISTILSYAGKDSSAVWPIADGVLNIELNGTNSYICAIEFKRENEGVHGLLTALGQSISYLEKGYNASIIVIPERYSSHSTPGKHLSDMISLTLPNAPIAIFTYEMPDATSPHPFRNKLTCIRNIELDINSSFSGTAKITSKNIVKTQWAHLREGSSESDSIFKYLQISKQIDPNNLTNPTLSIPHEILTAISSISSQDPLKYLSHCPNDSLCDYIWRNFWFSHVLTTNMMPLFTKDSSGRYHVNAVDSLILQNNGTSYKKFFYGRSDSPKEILVNQLNSNSITEAEAYVEYVKNINDRAHSYREDIDSTLLHIGLIHNDGRPTQLAYKFLDACERSNNANSSSALAIYSYAILKEGDLASFLFYIYKLSEELFSDNPLMFTTVISKPKKKDKVKFDKAAYTDSIGSSLANNLKVIQKYSLRGGKKRKPFQAEFAILRFLRIIGGFRPGVGLEINWPKVIDILSMDI